MTDKKIPLKFKLYMLFYPLKIFIKSLTNKIMGGEKMGKFNLEGKKAIVFGVANDQSIAWHDSVVSGSLSVASMTVGCVGSRQ